MNPHFWQLPAGAGSRCPSRQVSHAQRRRGDGRRATPGSVGRPRLTRRFRGVRCPDPPATSPGTVSPRKVSEVGAPPWSIVAVTFTKKASEEMRGRVREILGEEGASRVTIGTFHSLCVRILRRHGGVLPDVVPGLDASFSIFDREDSKRLLGKVLETAGVGKSEVRGGVWPTWGGVTQGFPGRGHNPSRTPSILDPEGIDTGSLASIVGGEGGGFLTSLRMLQQGDTWTPLRGGRHR